jgi:4-amino-4-deoxy-L-arabinose transferase-like glycosyltransferase
MALSSIRSAVKTALVVALWALFACAYYKRLPIPALGRQSYVCSVALLISLSALGYGHLLFRFLKLNGLTRAETVLLTWGSGMGILSLFLFAAGCLHAWTSAGTVALLIPGLLLSRPFFHHLQRESTVSIFSFLKTLPFSVPLLILCSGALFSFLIAFSPITYYDSLVYHLAMPAAYRHAQHWIRLPFLLYSAFPQTMEMFWTCGLLLHGDTVANLLGWGFTVCLVGGVMTFGRRYFDRSVALWAGALLAAMPAFLLLSSGGYIDVGLTFFSFYSLYCLFLWRDHGEKGWILLAGLFAGWAMGTKYTGAIPAALGGVVLVIECWRRNRPLLKVVAIYSATATFVFAPWLIKNMLYFGNPVFPFFYQWSSSHLNPWYHSAAAGYFTNLVEYQPRNFFQLLGLLWDSAAHGLAFGGGMDVLGDFGWAPLITLLPALWLCAKTGWATRRLLLYCALFIIPWGMSRPVLRFLLPLAPMLALLAAQAWVHGIQTQTKGLRWTGRFFLGSLFVSGGLIVIFLGHILSPLSVLAGFETRDAYLSRKLNYYPAAHFLNTQVPNVTGILVMGDQRGYYYDKPVMTTPVFSENPFIEMANQVASPQALREGIKAQGYSHVVINTPEMNRLSVYHIFKFTAQGSQNWHGLESLGKIIYQDNACEVLEL